MQPHPPRKIQSTLKMLLSEMEGKTSVHMDHRQAEDSSQRCFENKQGDLLYI